MQNQKAMARMQVSYMLDAGLTASIQVALLVTKDANHRACCVYQQPCLRYTATERWHAAHVHLQTLFPQRTSAVPAGRSCATTPIWQTFGRMCKQEACRSGGGRPKVC